MDKKTIRIIKLIPGTLVLRFQDAITYENIREFVIPAGREYINLPMNMVVSMFQLSGTMSLYNKGYFTFSQEDKEAIFEHARSLSLYYGDDDSGSDAQYEQSGILYTETEIREILRMRRTAEIDKIIAEGNRPQHTMLIEAARTMLNVIPVNIVNKIEKGLGVQLNEGDE